MTDDRDDSILDKVARGEDAHSILSTPLVGWRCLGYRLWEGKIYLQSGGGYWRPRARQESWCLYGTTHDPTVPDAGCSCGFYSYKSFSNLAQSPYPKSQPVVIQLYNWGRVIITRNGYRAQYVYPKAAAVPSKQVADLITRTYGIPCDAVNVIKLMQDERRRAFEQTIAELERSGETVTWEMRSHLLTKFNL